MKYALNLSGEYIITSCSWEHWKYHLVLSSKSKSPKAKDVDSETSDQKQLPCKILLKKIWRGIKIIYKMLCTLLTVITVQWKNLSQKALSQLCVHLITTDLNAVVFEVL